MATESRLEKLFSLVVALWVILAVGNGARADIVYSEDTTITANPKWAENVQINEGVTVTFGKNILPEHQTPITLTLDGSLVLESDKTADHGTDMSLITALGRSITIEGAGTIVKKGAGRTAIAADGNETTYATIALESGALIDIQEGTFVNGGWAGNHNWNDNKADMQLAAGASVDLWDGKLHIDSLVGAGTVMRKNNATNTITIGKDNSTWFAEDGVTSATPEFSGAFGISISLTKEGTGAQILSGVLPVCTIQVNAGELIVGNGTNGKIDKAATVKVGNNATLTFNTNDYTEFRADMDYTGAGTLNVNKGTLIFNRANNSFNGTWNVGDGGVLAMYTTALANATQGTIDAGGTIAYVIGDGTNGTISIDTYKQYRNEKTHGVGIFTPEGYSTTQAATDVFNVDKDFIKTGAGTLFLTGDGTAFTSNVNVRGGELLLKNATLKDDAVVTLSDDGAFGFDNGANSETVMKMSNIVGTGELVIASGTVKYTNESPIIATISARPTYIAVPNVTIRDGAKLFFADKITPTFSNPDGTALNATINVESGGVLQVENVDSGVGHNTVNSAQNVGGNWKLTGAGTFLKTGGGAFALLQQQNGGTVTIAQSEGGWIDVKEGTLISGGWSSSISWGNNKGSINLAEGASMCLWDGNPITIDSLTGAGTLYRGNGVILGVANNVNNEAYGVTNNTATFTGKLIDSDGKIMSVTKNGTGTQILAGDNNYTGETKVNAGTLQFGNGGSTGNIGTTDEGKVTGKVTVAVGATLAFNKTSETTIDNIVCNGSLANLGSGKLIINTPIKVFSGDVTVADEASVIQFTTLTDETSTFMGNITGAGKVQITNNSKLNLADATVANTTTIETNGGNVVLPQSFDATLSTTGDATMTLSQMYTPTPWTRTVYTDANKATGKLEPTSTNVTETPHGTSYDMWDGANNTNATEVAKFLPNYSVLSYRNVVNVLDNVTLDFNGKFDDFQSVWVIECDADGTPVSDATWRALQTYGGGCAENPKLNISLAKGTYLMDVRVADQSGNRYAINGVNDRNGRPLGVGFRLSGAGVYSAFDIDETTGIIGESGGTLVVGTPKTDFTFDGKLNIASDATLTFDNPYSDAQVYNINTAVTGDGTLMITDSANSSAKFNVNITTEGTLEIGDGLHVELMGEIGKNLVLGDDVVMDFHVSADTKTPLVQLRGNLVFGTDDIMNVVFEGEVPQGDQLLDLQLIQWADGTTMPPLEGINKNIIFEDLDMHGGLVQRDDGIYLVGGSSNALPEPGTWVLMVLGCVGLFYARNRGRKA